MDPIERIEKATAHASKIVSGVKTDQLSNSTPCSEFDVRLLLNHMIGGLEMLSTAASGGEGKMPEGDQFGPNPGEDYAARRAKLLDAVRSEGALDGTWKMPFGELPAQMMASIAFVEHVTHGWDLAKATGQDATIPDQLVSESLEVVTPMDAMWRMPGVCGPKVEVREDASPTDRFAGFMGRQP
jgi:uncharacterized protein (TIGR03086 family)